MKSKKFVPRNDCDKAFLEKFPMLREPPTPIALRMRMQAYKAHLAAWGASS